MKGSNYDNTIEIEVQSFFKSPILSKEEKEMENIRLDQLLSTSASSTSIQNNQSHNELSRLIISLQKELSSKIKKIMKIHMEKARNNKALDSYRDTVRSKNCTIKTLEKQICELKKNQYSSGSVLKTDQISKKYDQHKSDIQEKKYIDLISSLKNENRKYQRRINEYSDEENEYEGQISDLKRDLRLLQKKLKLVGHSQLIEHKICQKEEIKIKERTNTKLAYDLTKLQQLNLGYQEKMVDLRCDILRLEKIVSECEYKKKMLKYQLSMARNVANFSNNNIPIVLLEPKLAINSNIFAEEEEVTPNKFHIESNKNISKSLIGVEKNNDDNMNQCSTSNNINNTTKGSKHFELVSQDLSDVVMVTPQRDEELSVEEIAPGSRKTKRYNGAKGDEYTLLHYDDIDISNMIKEVFLEIPLKPVDNTITVNDIETLTLSERRNHKKQHETNDVKLSIMKNLSESQQETIGSLSRSLNELRRDLSNKQELRHNISAIADRKKIESDSLKKENELFAAEIVSTEHEMEKLRNTLSAKLGENACLKDEIHELEYKINENSTRDDLTKKSYQDKIHELELIISGRKKLPSSHSINKSINITSSIQVQHKYEIDQVEKKIKRKYEEKFKILEEKAKSYQGRINGVESLLFGKKDLLMTNTKAHSSDEESLLKPRKRRERELVMLKKVLRQKYEGKFEDLGIRLERKNAEITRLRDSITDYQETLTQHRDEIEQQRRARISQEAELSEREQELIYNLAKRDEHIVQLKLKLTVANGSYLDDRDAWEKVSNTVSAGVNAGIDMLSMLSLTPERSNIKERTKQ